MTKITGIKLCEVGALLGVCWMGIILVIVTNTVYTLWGSRWTLRGFVRG